MIEGLYKTQRIYVKDPLADGMRISCSKEHAHYLLNVLRLQEGDGVGLFNGRDGEWDSRIIEKKKKACTLLVGERIREQTQPNDLHYIFAPLKRTRLDYMIQKATEMGASKLQPVRTAYTQVARVNIDRMVANTIEAAEQCRILSVPMVCEPMELRELLTTWEPDRRLVFCDEAAKLKNPLEALQAIKGHPVAVLIGPEGGFRDDERECLLRHPSVIPISLGPRVMRADTAAVAALALVNAILDYEDASSY